MPENSEQPQAGNWPRKRWLSGRLQGCTRRASVEKYWEEHRLPYGRGSAPKRPVVLIPSRLPFCRRTADPNRLFADTECGKNPVEDIVGSSCASNGVDWAQSRVKIQ